ncbi:MAG: WYL domain-containing protein [Nannocystaceae bacterium]|nr:WYL domain-containing protein [Nannocystaceae bacterium]
MPRADSIGRLERLDFIEARLKSGELMTQAALASEAGVSLRTLSRDLELLRSRGFPVEAERGRGGGVRMHRDWGVGRLKLDFAEAAGLLVSLAVAEKMNSPLLMTGLASVKRKLLASLPARTKSRVRHLRRRILITGSASTVMMSGYQPGKSRAIEPLQRAFVDAREMTIRYRDLHGVRTTRRIEPHYLLLSYPVWYAVAFHHLRGEVRTFRCDRIESAQVGEAEFKQRPLSFFATALEGIDVIES